MKRFSIRAEDAYGDTVWFIMSPQDGVTLNAVFEHIEASRGVQVLYAVRLPDVEETDEPRYYSQ